MVDLSFPPTLAPRGARPPIPLSVGPSTTAAAGWRWEALLATPGLSSNRYRRPAAVLKRAAALFIGAPVRVSTSISDAHGVGPRPAGREWATALHEDSGFVQSQWLWILQMCSRNELEEALRGERALDELPAAHLETRLAPVPVGRVIDARFEPYDGVVGTIEFDGIAPDGPFAWLGVIPTGVEVGSHLARQVLGRHRELLRLSDVSIAHHRDGLASDGGRCEETVDIVSVVAIDLVVIAASPAHLIRPL